MNEDKRQEYVTRDRILRLLTDVEVARVSTAETAPRLGAGEEYIDLEQIEQGVQRAPTTSGMNNILPKKAVSRNTWDEILLELRPSGTDKIGS